MTLLMRDNEMMEKGRNDMLFHWCRTEHCLLRCSNKGRDAGGEVRKSHERSRIFYKGASMREDYHIYYENEEELSVWQPEIKM